MNRSKLLIPLLGLCCLFACETKEDLQSQVQTLIDERVEERRRIFIQTLKENCEERVMAEANRIVDSILIAEARLSKDSINKPLRPERPEVPELRRPKDTLPVAPLFPDSQNIRTQGR